MAISSLDALARKVAAGKAGAGGRGDNSIPGVTPNVVLPVRTPTDNRWGAGNSLTPANGGSGGGTGTTGSGSGSGSGLSSLASFDTDPVYLDYLSKLAYGEETARTAATQQSGSVDNDAAIRADEIRRAYEKARGVSRNASRLRGTLKSSQRLNILANMANDEGDQVNTSMREAGNMKNQIQSALQQQLANYGMERGRAGTDAASRRQQREDALELQKQLQQLRTEMADQQKTMQQQYLDMLAQMSGGAVNASVSTNAPAPVTPGQPNPSPGPSTPGNTQNVLDLVTRIRFLQAMAASNPQAAYINSMAAESQLANLGYDRNGNPLMVSGA